MRRYLFRPLLLTVLAFAVIVLVSWGLTGALAWRDHGRLDNVRAHLERMRELQKALLRLERTAADRLDDDEALQRQRIAELRVEIENVIARGGHLDAGTPERLREARRLLDDPRLSPSGAVIASLHLLREILTTETAVLARLVTGLASDTRDELILALTVPVALLAAGGLILLAARRRIVGPLDMLGTLVSHLARGQFEPVPVDRVDPLLLPLFDNYNHLVTRLQELEGEHRSRAASLEQEVKIVTRALLKQQQGLARAERLAAAGEMAASVAHELRNPLAGIQLTLANLRQDLTDPDLIERLDLVIAESGRVSRLLDGLLNLSRHSPEKPRTVRLARMVSELLALVRFQVSPDRKFDARIPDDLAILVPRDGLRQVLLNLILNSSEALAGRGGTIEISATIEGPTLHVQVRDDGPGFNDRMLAGKIRPFFTTRERGMGLGLAMVSRFARDLGGELSLANREPHGASVTLSIPYEASDG